MKKLMLPLGVEIFFLENAGELCFIILRRLKPGDRAPRQHTTQLGY
jgi:hypothetical protein